MTTQVTKVLEQIDEKQPLATLAFLDCCREHVELQRGGAFGAGGLSALPGPAGSLVMYAAGQGKLAADGTASRNGALTAALGLRAWLAAALHRTGAVRPPERWRPDHGGVRARP